MTRAANPLAAAALRTLSAIFGRGVALRNRHFDRTPSAVRHASIPVISIGNLTVGGTGKTPLVAWLATTLGQSDRRPAVVSRGYRGRAGRGPLLVSATTSARIAGDEPCLLARTLGGVAVVVGSDRAAGAAHAASLGADVAILDDGFQHRRLARDLDIVLLDAGDPFGGGRLLPAGRLREPLSALGRADVLIVTRAEGRRPYPEIEDVVRRFNRDAPLFRAGHRPLCFVDAAGRPVPAPPRAVGFSGIGNPRRFQSDLEAAGVELVAFRAFRDHHPYTPRELHALAEEARQAGARLVTTEKDLVRLELPAPELADLVALRIEATVHDAGELLDHVRRAIERKVGR